jgi:uncharacterized metal-binding protein
MDYLFFCFLLVLYPLLALWNFYKKRRWGYFAFLSFFFAIGLVSIFWAIYHTELAGDICAISYMVPFFLCGFLNIICGVMHLLSYLTKKTGK